ncbi:uncharacterized protein LOC131068219 isoform X2 [Cryptomeria japonica]|uniref:uncharacterized protein LOC131068219 isoform X2 n=1 Tax=Cryptomeria japonica TaxID=3369 RepID=UPI0025AC2C68|nr:uncharacterized protein LOC131068219 isoform X2 [Cryptomeria japonica]
MKFKGFLTDNGVYLLERKFVPALEKIGKNCHLYLTKDHVIFLHNVLNADGVQAIAQFKKGYKSAIIQDVPISNPLSRVDVHELQSALDMAQELPQTLVQVPDLVQLQSLIDRLKNVGEVLDVAITQYGDFHLKVSTTCITIGSDYRRLRVVGVRANDASSLDETVSSSARIERAIQRGEASSVQVNIKHFAKSIQCHLARPDAAFYGIATQGACLTVIFQFFVPGTRQTDNSISLHCRLPVLDPGFC